jgi:hypothetical protein
VLLCDVSSRGLGLFGTMQLRLDTRLYIEFENRAVRPSPARVVHLTEDSGGWLLGCLLGSPLREAELLALRR